MISVERRQIEACCGQKQLTIKFNGSLFKSHIEIFVKEGFTVQERFVKSGILFLDDENISASCPFGQNELHIKCKNKDCLDSVSKIEKIILASL